MSPTNGGRWLIMDMTVRILNKMASRCKIGWVDYSTLSPDWKVADARAVRIRLRLRGIRKTLQQVLND